MTRKQYRDPPTTPLSWLPSPHPPAAADGADSSIELAPDVGLKTEPQTSKPADIGSGTAKIGLIDGHQLSQEYLRNAFESLVPGLSVCSFASVQDFLATPSDDFGLVIYFWHVADASATTAMQEVAGACAGSPDTPLVVLSDAKEAQHLRTVRTTLMSGARGFIPTRTTGIQMALAAIRLVRAGGTFAPLDLLLSGQPVARRRRGRPGPAGSRSAVPPRG